MEKKIPEYKKDTLVNLKKASSLLAKIIKMTEDNQYCIDLMQQNLAVIGLLKSANQKLMQGHLNGCFKNAVSSKNIKKQQEMIEEILQVTKLSNR
ncbi:MAG: metal-sensing transcriptional repressor [bacterium]